MDEYSNGRERFFKVMMPGFDNHLNLPQALCKKLKVEGSCKAVIKTLIGTFQVQVFRNHELGLISFKDGWPDFVHRHGLSIGEFVVFEHIGNFHFNAILFDVTACEKKYYLTDSMKEPIDDEPKEIKREADEKSIMPMSHQRKNPFFIKTMMPYNERGYEVCIPAKFWRSNNIAQKAKVVLRDPCGRDWPVNLSIQKDNTKGKITKGWRDFSVANKLKLGDVCVFELITSNNDDVVMAVEIFPATL